MMKPILFSSLEKIKHKIHIMKCLLLFHVYTVHSVCVCVNCTHTHTVPGFLFSCSQLSAYSLCFLLICLLLEVNAKSSSPRSAQVHHHWHGVGQHRALLQRLQQVAPRVPDALLSQQQRCHWLRELEARRLPTYLNLYQKHYSIYILNVSQAEGSKQSVLL